MAAEMQASARAQAPESAHQSQIAFHLTGRRSSADLEALQGPALRPALLARCRDLSALRYDFPLVLQDSADKDYVQCLSGVIDAVIHEIAHDEDAERLTRHLMRLEREVRVLAAGGTKSLLTRLWDSAAGRLAVDNDALLRESLERGHRALKLDGEVVDCDRQLPDRLLAHAWHVVQQAKVRTNVEDIRRLRQRLADILEADRVRSSAGRTPANLQASVGAVHASVFDFEAMSRVLGTSTSASSLAEGRRQRIERLLSVFDSQRFFPLEPDAEALERCYSFCFDRCSSALVAYWQRQPLAEELAKAIAIAELEIAGEYNESIHDALFAGSALVQDQMARFPDYWISVNARDLKAAESSRLIELLSAELPVKILVQTDDLIDQAPLAGDAHLTFGMHAKQLANTAIELNGVFVLQCAASHLFQYRERVLKAMAYRGPALFSIYSGASSNRAALPTYLEAAAAMEARVFPAYTYDPSAGPNWAARFSLDGNAQAETDWPVQAFEYEDDNHQRVTEKLAFTPIDYLSCDPRYARHFARVPRASWNGSMLPVGDYLAADATGLPEKLPCVLMVDRDNMLQKAIVDDTLLRAARRCREQWHSLQERGGIHNSYAEQLLERERKVWQEQAHPVAETRAEASQAEVPAAAAPAAAAPVTVIASPQPETAHSSDEAYIETPRCTTCNECTQINSKMFAYDDNKQAYIADITAGTYRQLVEAAEGCQVAIIHPGKPRNSNEAGLEELIQRAEPFL